jgi:hypothetical protein
MAAHNRKTRRFDIVAEPMLALFLVADLVLKADMLKPGQF